MPEPEKIPSGDHSNLHEILVKILKYLQSLPDGRAVELEEFRRENILSSADFEFMAVNSVIYKPRKYSAYRRGAYVLKKGTLDGGFQALGLKGEPLKHRTYLRDFPHVIRKLLEVPESDDELLMHISLAEHDGMAVSPGFIMFNVRSDSWRERLPTIRSVALELGFEPFQDQDYGTGQAHWLVYRIPRDPGGTCSVVDALLRRGCEMGDDSEVIYSAAALDED
jgi:hypothetical protein